MTQEVLLRLQAQVLESVAHGIPSAQCLTQLCKIVEEVVADSICSVMLLDPVQQALFVAVAPRAPKPLCQALDGLVPGALAGSCGTAVFEGSPVYVHDTSTDERWASKRDIATEFGIGACWSVPIFSRTGDTLGSFAISHPRPRRPEELHKSILETASHLAGIAIDREQEITRLTESETHLNDLYQNAPDMFLTVDAATARVICCNEAVVETLGYDRNEIQSCSLWDLHTPENKSLAQEWFSGVRSGLEIDPIDLHVVCKNGEILDVGVRASTIADDQGHVKSARIVWRDVTEQKKAEHALRESKKLESLGLLAGGIAHDFNNLLVGIVGNAHLALTQVEKGSKAHESIQSIEGAGRRAAGLTRQLLTYAGGRDMRLRPLSLNELVRETAQAFRSNGPQRTYLNLSESDPWVVGDDTQIGQVLMNLFTNAAEAMADPARSVQVRTGNSSPSPEYLEECKIPVSNRESEYAFVDVEDTGHGMDAETAEKIFDPFFTTRASGHGLGLAATLGTMKAHRGTIHVTSSPGAGTRIRLLFPLVQPVPRQITPHTPTTDDYASATVLIVDDDHTVLEVLSSMLTQLGFEVITAGDGASALARLQDTPDIGAVILDCMMPGLSGIDTYGELRRARPDLPVLFCSGCKTVCPVSCDKVTDFLTKPFTPRELRSSLGALLSAGAK